MHNDKQLLAFEIKNSPRFSRSWLRGLKEFGKDYPEAELFVLYTGREKMFLDRVQVIPIADYLFKLSVYLS